MNRSIKAIMLGAVTISVAMALASPSRAGEPIKGEVTTTEPKKVQYPRQNLPDSTHQGGRPTTIPPTKTVPMPDPCVSKPEQCVK